MTRWLHTNMMPYMHHFSGKTMSLSYESLSQPSQEERKTLQSGSNGRNWRGMALRDSTLFGVSLSPAQISEQAELMDNGKGPRTNRTSRRHWRCLGPVRLFLKIVSFRSTANMTCQEVNLMIRYDHSCTASPLTFLCIASSGFWTPDTKTVKLLIMSILYVNYAYSRENWNEGGGRRARTTGCNRNCITLNCHFESVDQFAGIPQGLTRLIALRLTALRLRQSVFLMQGSQRRAQKKEK